MIVTKDEWITALETGGYRKGHTVLRSTRDWYCCIGVLCDLINPNAWDEAKPYTMHHNWTGFGIPHSAFLIDTSDRLKLHDQHIISRLNDDYSTWSKVIEYIRETQPDVIFDDAQHIEREDWYATR